VSRRQLSSRNWPSNRKIRRRKTNSELNKRRRSKKPPLKLKELDWKMNRSVKMLRKRD